MFRELIESFEDWFYSTWNSYWYYRHGKIKYVVYEYGDLYCASATNQYCGVFNCCAGTPEMAKEIAKFRLKQAMEEMITKKETVFSVNGEHYKAEIVELKKAPTQRE